MISKPNIGDEMRRVEDVLFKSHHPLRVSDIAAEAGLDKGQALRRLGALIDSGRVGVWFVRQTRFYFWKGVR